MLSIFKDAIRTPKQRARYFWVKRITAVCCAAVAAKYSSPYVGDLAIAVGVVVFVLSYVTIAPVFGVIVCLLEELASL